LRRAQRWCGEGAGFLRTVLQRAGHRRPVVEQPREPLPNRAELRHGEIGERRLELAEALAPEKRSTSILAQATLGDVLRGGTKRITVDKIQRAVSVHFDLKPVDLVSAPRRRGRARAPDRDVSRQAACPRARSRRSAASSAGVITRG
jgi:hypothetical protein